jgi:hypothetical protein
MYWLDSLVESGIIHEKRTAALRSEADEILSMVVASVKTARSRR